MNTELLSKSLILLFYSKLKFLIAFLHNWIIQKILILQIFMAVQYVFNLLL